MPVGADLSRPPPFIGSASGPINRPLQSAILPVYFVNLHYHAPTMYKNGTSDDSLRLKPRASTELHRRCIALQQCSSVSLTRAGVTHRPLYRVARFENGSVFTQGTPYPGTHRNTIPFFTCKRTAYSIAEDRINV